MAGSFVAGVVTGDDDDESSDGCFHLSDVLGRPGEFVPPAALGALAGCST